MKLSPQGKGIILAIVSGLAAIGMAFAAGQIVRQKQIAKSPATTRLSGPFADAQVSRGYELFQLNCAHCHGSDARGDEGPDLHGVAKSDARISSLIKNGIKGEMPKFGEKLTDTDVNALIAFLRTLKDA